MIRSERELHRERCEAVAIACERVVLAISVASLVMAAVGMLW